MGNKKVSSDDFTLAIYSTLNDYSKAVVTAEKEAVDTVADEVNEAIRSHISFKQHTGKYVKAFRVKTTAENAFKKVKTWYVAAPQYRLTHLLEKGHAVRGGGRTRAFPHIQYGEEIAEARMTELSEKAVEDAGH